MKIILLLGVFLCSAMLYAQEEPIEIFEPEEQLPFPPKSKAEQDSIANVIIDFPTEQASFPGGEEAMMKFIMNNLNNSTNSNKINIDQMNLFIDNLFNK